MDELDARRARMKICLDLLGFEHKSVLAEQAGQTKQQLHAWMASASDHACSKFALSCRKAGLAVSGDWIAYEYGPPPAKVGAVPLTAYSHPNPVINVIVSALEQLNPSQLTEIALWVGRFLRKDPAPPVEPPAPISPPKDPRAPTPRKTGT